MEGVGVVFPDLGCVSKFEARYHVFIQLSNVSVFVNSTHSRSGVSCSENKFWSTRVIMNKFLNTRSRVFSKFTVLCILAS